MMRITTPCAAALVAILAAPTLAALQQIVPTFAALKTTARQNLEGGAMVQLTLQSGATAKFRATDIDWDRTYAYKGSNLVVIMAETVTEMSEKTTGRKYLNLTFSRRYVQTVWTTDVDYDVMRSGFALYNTGRDNAIGATDVDRTIQGKCTKDWPDDFRMRDYVRRPSTLR